jgi:hypothetical protein
LSVTKALVFNVAASMGLASVFSIVGLLVGSPVG